MNVMSDVDILWEATVWTLAYTMLVFREDPSVQWKFLLSLLGRLFRPIQTWENGCCLISWISQSCGKNKEYPREWIARTLKIDTKHTKIISEKYMYVWNQIRFRYIKIVRILFIMKTLIVKWKWVPTLSWMESILTRSPWCCLQRCLASLHPLVSLVVIR